MNIRNAGGTTIDFDGDPLKLVKSATQMSQNNVSERFDQYKKDYRLSNSYIDMSNRDPDMANLFVPKIWSIIRNKYPQDVKAHTGVRPYFPMEAKQKDNPLYEVGTKAWEDYVDDLMFLANWRGKMTISSLIKTTYGTSFMEPIPYYDTETFQLRMKVKVRSPWELLVDNLATGLEEPGQCRYVVAIDVVSKREIIKLALQSGYPGLDIEKLVKLKDSAPTVFANEKGQEILNSIGLGRYNWDSDIGVVLRYQSEERYIDVWNDTLVLRAIENPFPHKLINISRYIHDPDSHTRNQFWGIGECKPNEVMQDFLNGLTDMSADSWMQTLQPLTMYDETAVKRNSVVRSFGNKIPVKRMDESLPLSNYLHEIPGQELPVSHYNMIQMTEDRMDMSSGNYEVQRGEVAGGDQTAFEIAKLDERGSARQELNISLGEDVLLNSFSSKLISTVTAAAQPDDLVRCLGMEKAMYALAAKPTEIDGGYRIMLTGSSKVSAQAIRLQSMERVFANLVNLPNTNKGKLATMYAEANDIGKDDIQELIIPDEVLFQQQLALSQANSGNPDTNQSLQNKNNQEYRAGE